MSASSHHSSGRSPGGAASEAALRFCTLLDGGMNLMTHGSKQNPRNVNLTSPAQATTCNIHISLEWRLAVLICLIYLDSNFQYGPNLTFCISLSLFHDKLSFLP